ncbi:MAG TPA: hypothetical protein VHM90_09645, partial [Phycisphaerae bacterium]|nr:hypothetical protein [Phycisphaerae bacterium]
MLKSRLMLVAAALTIAVGASVSMLTAATPGSAPATTAAATKVGSVSGKVVDKDGKPAANAQV